MKNQDFDLEEYKGSVSFFLQELGIKKTYSLLKIVDEMMATYKDEEGWHLAYLLQDRDFVTKKKKRAHVTEILFSKTTEEKIKKLIDNEITIREAINVEGMYSIGKVNNHVFPKKEETFEYIKDKTPRENIFLNDGRIMNQVSLQEVWEEIEKK